MVRILFALFISLIISGNIQAANRVIKTINAEPSRSKYITIDPLDVIADLGPTSCIWILSRNVMPDHCKMTLEVKFDSTGVNGSHVHDNYDSMPLGTILINGRATDNYEYFDGFDETTTVEFITPPFSGKYRITVTFCTNIDPINHPCGKNDYVVNVAVPGLVKLPHSAFYSIVGNCDKHENQCHWGRPGTLKFIEHLGVIWSGSLNTSVRLGINDISLPLGGHFDYKGTWRAPHKSHFYGEDIDINLVPKEYSKLLEAFARSSGDVDKFFIYNTHQHIRLNKI